MPEAPLEPPRLYPIADRGVLGATTLAQAVELLSEAGATWVQLRAKDLGDRELCSEVESCCRVAEGTGTLLWINDRVDVAALFPVAGVHLGQSDLPPGAARGIVGDEVWIGRSTHTEEEVRVAAADEDVDVIAVGPVFATESKPDHEAVVGLDFVRRARRLTEKPLVAIGGVDSARIRAVLAAGADAAAAVGAVCRGPVRENFRRLARAVEA